MRSDLLFKCYFPCLCGLVFLQCVRSVLLTLSYSVVLPSSKGISEGLLFGKAPTLSTIETRVTYSSVSIDLRVSWVKFWLGRVLVFLCFCSSDP